MRFALTHVVLAVVLGACSSSSSSSPSSAGTAVTQSIGSGGGQIVVGAATVTFPVGAVSSTQSITITESNDPAPSGFALSSKVYHCEPSGLSFMQPVTMTMPFTDDANATTMFWSSAANPNFADVGGTKSADGKTWSATVMHFSSGFVGKQL
jgi:ZU5 domain